jgi:hypothetical protein
VTLPPLTVTGAVHAQPLPFTGPPFGLSARFQKVTVRDQFRSVLMAVPPPWPVISAPQLLPDVQDPSVKRTSLDGYALRTVVCPLTLPP